MSLFLVQAVVETTHNPGDDDMRQLPPETVLRLVEAENVAEAEQKFTDHVSRYEPFHIRVDVRSVEASEVLR